MTIYSPSEHFLESNRAGQPGYIKPRPKGTVEVTYDGTRYFYRQDSRFSQLQIKTALLDALRNQRGDELRAIGQWPCYEFV